MQLKRFQIQETKMTTILTMYRATFQHTPDRVPSIEELLKLLEKLTTSTQKSNLESKVLKSGHKIILAVCNRQTCLEPTPKFELTDSQQITNQIFRLYSKHH